MNHKIKFLGVLSICVLGAVGCNGSADSNSATGGSSAQAGTTGGAGADANKPLKLAFVTNNSSDYWTIARKGVNAAVKELGPSVQVDFRMPADGTAAGQTTIVNDLLARGIDGMAMSPVDPKNETDLINKAAQSTLVFTQDSDAPSSNRACYVGTDNVAAGKLLGQQILKYLANGGRIYCFVGNADAQNAQDRINGVKSALQGSKVQLIDVIQDGTDHTKAKTNVADILVKDPNVAGLVGIWSYNGPAIYEAVQDAGKAGKIQILCFDEEKETLTGITKGAIDATVVQHPYDFGHDSIVMMAKYLRGDKSVIPANKLDNIPAEIINKDNLAAYQAKMDKIRALP